jgi:TRAP-type uncharacterized transport system fused permease subunit
MLMQIKTKIIFFLVFLIFVSYTLSQLALKRKLNSVYDVLFASQGAEISIYDMSEYNTKDGEISFAEIQRSVLAINQIAIGYLNEDSLPVLNPPKERILNITSSDRVIVLQENL